jgi:ribonucleoside-diphosphate reductase beta chain
MLQALIFWFMIFEGIWFMLNLKGPLQSLARRGLFVGAAEQFQYIARDEESHVQFGHGLIREFIKQYPECWNRNFKESIIQLFYDGINLEAAYAEYCQADGPILGYSVADHIETAKHFANLKARALELPDIYPGVRHRFPWMSEQLEIRKEKNFFETRPTEYQTGGSLAWGEDDQDLFDHLLGSKK